MRAFGARGRRPVRAPLVVAQNPLMKPRSRNGKVCAKPGAKESCNAIRMASRGKERSRDIKSEGDRPETGEPKTGSSA